MNRRSWLLLGRGRGRTGLRVRCAFRLAKALTALKRYTEARVAAERVLKLNPSTPGAAAVLRAARDGELAAAVAAAERVREVEARRRNFTTIKVRYRAHSVRLVRRQSGAPGAEVYHIEGMLSFGGY